MKTIKFILNDREVETELPAGTVTLDFIRREQGLSGAKEGCREGECGSCTILLGELQNRRVKYKAVVSCLLPIGELHGKHVVTVEGLNSDKLTPVQQALVDQGAVQCGFCTPGIVLSLTGFLLSEEAPAYPAAIDALDGNICRCTGYVSIRRAAESLCTTILEKSCLSGKNSKQKKIVSDGLPAGGGAPLAEKAGKDKNGNNGAVPELVEWGVVPRYFLDIPARLEALDAPAPAPNSTKVKKILAAGATDMYVQKGEEAAGLELDFLSRYPELSGIKEEGEKIFIGAGTNTEEIKNSSLLARFVPGIKEYLSLVASKLIRSRATIGGNIANASPIADLTIFFLALKADIVLGKGSREREMPLAKFFKGYKQLGLRKGEKIFGIKFPKPEAGAFFNFEKVSRRKYLDIASCDSAIYLTLQNGEAFSGDKGKPKASEANQKFL
ncbi:MAG: FAD binding domain-containing protein, partial [Candidatus Aminicenantes bacterium]|nr:FAD binding domain-containing protein [Candidatus Aminicenantes bacterium]